MTLLDEPAHWLSIFQAEKPAGFEFVDVLGEGKSAVAFRARDSSGSGVAIKVYDLQRLARFGLEIQQERMSRELSLQDHDCRDLVQVRGGGTFTAAGTAFAYIALELIDGDDLRNRVTAGRLHDSEIRRHLASLQGAANFLDARDLCHRDIKVDNCRLRATGDLVLLDLGVLRPIHSSDLTDDKDDPRSKYFLGTLRYAPPEFLRRQESNDRDAWRAITVYQIGTVLYEMVHGVQLFSHIREPYAELVEAVLHTQPTVMRQDIDMPAENWTR